METEVRRLLDRGVDLFNRQEFFEAHEAWEDAWRMEQGETRRFLQGLIQVAAGFVKLQRRQPRGATSLLGSGMAKLGDISATGYGLDLESLIAATVPWQQIAAGKTAGEPIEMDPDSLPRLKAQQEPRA